MRIVGSGFDAVRRLALVAITAAGVAACSFNAADVAIDNAPDAGSIGPVVGIDAARTTTAVDAATAPDVAASFAFAQGSDGSWAFQVAAADGAALLASNSYSDRTDAITGALSVMTNGTAASNYDVAQSGSGYVARLHAANTNVIATTAPLATNADATTAISTCVTAIAAYNAKRAEPATGAHLQLTTTSGSTTFAFIAADGDAVLTSQSYSTTASAYNAAFSAQANGASASSYQVSSGSGNWWFTLHASNGDVMGTSPQYASQSAATSARDAVIAMLPSICVL